jgi:hypothetical protein
MYKSENVMKLISELECIVANCYHNKQKRGGFYFRYPVKYIKNGTDYECKNKIPKPEAVELGTMRYEMGANQLYIGHALFKVLEYLEDRYDLDFDDLEDFVRSMDE